LLIAFIRSKNRKEVCKLRCVPYGTPVVNPIEKNDMKAILRSTLVLGFLFAGGMAFGQTAQKVERYRGVPVKKADMPVSRKSAPETKASQTTPVKPQPQQERKAVKAAPVRHKAVPASRN
jgi:hypothetical protein